MSEMVEMAKDWPTEGQVELAQDWDAIARNAREAGYGHIAVSLRQDAFELRRIARQQEE